MTEFDRFMRDVQRTGNILRGVQCCCDLRCGKAAEYGVYARNGHDTYACGEHLADLLTVPADAGSGELTTVTASWTVVPLVGHG